ncbi:ABC transporter ATP-binding protein [Elizabethkingia anophelis]|uniref:ABC transporter ATP-binding protein n=1 Tax=Elizabethkingia anophelis TaxID=1117645 RepID=UPI0006653049|nr:ABC transporter ATP-binding protein [Elizabethkingia anophelis]
MQSEVILKLEHLDIGYQRALVKDICAELKLGEVCLLMGNNGQGKTTLIKSILGENKLLNGDILLAEQSIKTLSSLQIAKKISVVFSKATIPNGFTVKDLISLGKYIHYPYYFSLNKKDKEEVVDIINKIGLQEYTDMPLQQLSDGNLQKAFIGRALVQNTSVIILDEPTTHLDEKNKTIVLTTLRMLAKEYHKTILFSSHDWRLAKEFSDKIWYIKEGRLYSGVAEDILSVHQELTAPALFHFNEAFVTPHIEAPQLQKEMLFSVLQKNFKKDLSQFNFIFQDGIWDISSDTFQKKAESFEEIIQLIGNL